MKTISLEEYKTRRMRSLVRKKMLYSDNQTLRDLAELLLDNQLSPTERKQKIRKLVNKLAKEE